MEITIQKANPVLLCYSQIRRDGCIGTHFTHFKVDNNANKFKIYDIRNKGERKTMRKIIKQPPHGGASCPNLLWKQPCNQQTCSTAGPTIPSKPTPTAAPLKEDCFYRGCVKICRHVWPLVEVKLLKITIHDAFCVSLLFINLEG